MLNKLFSFLPWILRDLWFLAHFTSFFWVVSPQELFPLRNLRDGRVDIVLGPYSAAWIENRLSLASSEFDSLSFIEVLAVIIFPYS